MIAAMETQRRGGKSESFSAQQSGDRNVAAGCNFVGLHANADAKVVQHQHLLRFGRPSSQGKPACLMEVTARLPVLRRARLTAPVRLALRLRRDVLTNFATNFTEIRAG